MSSETQRLYISPFSAALEEKILNPAQRASATNTSFHSIQTFQDKPFGYLELPVEEAQKLRRKFNGSTLRGMKMRVEEARAEKRKSQTTDETSPAARKRSTKKREEGVLPGVELSSERIVKRGWSGANKNAHASNKQRGSQKEATIRTKLPPNRTTLEKPTTEPQGKLKKSKQNKATKTTDVKEFANTIKYPSFLRDRQSTKDAKRTAEYVEGKGWFDADGGLIEPEGTRQRNARQKAKDAQISALRQSEEAESIQSEAEAPDGGMVDIDSESRSVNMQDATEESSDVTSEQDNGKDMQEAEEDNKRDASPQNHSSPTKAPHPLESLFKRFPPKSKKNKSGSAMRPPPLNTSFSFGFGEADADEDPYTADRMGLSNLNPPQTPFTRRDLEGRSIRSAAPTPDTAAIGRRFSMPWKRRSQSVEDKDDDDDDDGGDEDAEEMQERGGSTQAEGSGSRGKSTAGSGEKSEWEKHFWENRGDFNRAWKARRREKRKEQRQAENRRSAR